MACSRSDREMMPLTTSALSTRTSRWTWDKPESDKERMLTSYSLMLKKTKTFSNSSEEHIYLSFDNTVYDGFQGFIRVALDNPFHITHAPASGLLHGHVQIVVSLLGR